MSNEIVPYKRQGNAQLYDLFLEDVLYLPGLKRASVDMSGRVEFPLAASPRKVDWSAVQRRSVHAVPPRPIDIFIGKELMRSDRNQKALHRLQEQIALKIYDGVSSDVADRDLAAINYAYTGRGSVDALFFDVYRLLLEPSSIFRQEHTRSEEMCALLEGVRRSPGFAALVGMVHGDEERAGAISTLILESMGSSDTVSDTLADSDGACESEEEGHDDDVEGDGEGKGDGGEVSEGATDSESDGEGDGVSDELQDALNSVMQDAASSASASFDDPHIEEASDMVDGLGDHVGTQPGADYDRHTDVSRVRGIVQSAERILLGPRFESSNILRISELLGRMDGVLARGIAASKHGTGEVVNITTGNTLRDVLPCDIAPLVSGIEELELFALQKYASEEMMQLERIGLTDTGKGPVIVYLDCSYSMDDHVVFAGKSVTCSVVAGAFAYAFCQHVSRWNRPFVLIPFCTRAHVEEMFVWTPRRSKSDMMLEMEAALALCPTGGTDFTATLETSYMHLSKMRIFDISKADVLFFSDGYGGVSKGGGADAERQKRARLAFGDDVGFYGFFIAENETKERLEEVEKDNSALFDFSIAVNGKDLTEGIKRLTQELIARAMYKGM